MLNSHIIKYSNSQIYEMFYTHWYRQTKPTYIAQVFIAAKTNKYANIDLVMLSTM